MCIVAQHHACDRESGLVKQTFIRGEQSSKRRENALGEPRLTTALAPAPPRRSSCSAMRGAPSGVDCCSVRRCSTNVRRCTELCARRLCGSWARYKIGTAPLRGRVREGRAKREDEGADIILVLINFFLEFLNINCKYIHINPKRETNF